MLGEAPIEHVDAAALWTFIRLAHPFEAAGRDEIADLPFAQPADNLLLGRGCVTAPGYRWWYLVALRLLPEEISTRRRAAGSSSRFQRRSLLFL